MRKIILIFVTIGVVFILLFIIARYLIYKDIEKSMYQNDRDVEKTPADLGLDYEDLEIEIESRKLQAWFVQAQDSIDCNVAVLIFHGGGETVAYWTDIQKYLYEKGISSMVYDYSAYGNSTGEPIMSHFREDAIAAYEKFKSKVNLETHKYLLGFSMGVAILLEALEYLEPSMDGVILIGGWSSWRDWVVSVDLAPASLIFIAPDVYNNVTVIKQINKPVLIVHSEADEAAPISHAHKLFQAANEPKKLEILKGFSHDAAWKHPTDKYWSQIIRFMQETRLP